MTGHPQHDLPLEGMRILIAEDEFLIAATIEETLENAGAEVVATATLEAATRVAQSEGFSAAILDMRLGRQTTETVVDLLSARGVPLVVYTGEPLPASVRANHPNLKMLSKPARQAELVAAILETMAPNARDDQD